MKLESALKIPKAIVMWTTIGLISLAVNGYMVSAIVPSFTVDVDRLRQFSFLATVP